MRKPREYSESGFYHSIAQGVDKQNLFYENSDRYFFISLLEKYSYKYRVEIHTYVLMDNHLHLLLRDNDKNISQFMQSVTSVYARFFNNKYDRIGHLFNDRFMSKPVEDTDYLLNCFQYIINNPQKENISKINAYKWSSYYSYKSKNTFVKTDYLKTILGGEDKLYKFLNTNQPQTKYIYLEPRKKKSEILKNQYIKICTLLKSDSPIIQSQTDIKEKTEKIKLLIQEGFSINTISRITRVSKYIIRKSIS